MAQPETPSAKQPSVNFLVVAASSRAIARSIKSAGFECSAVDLFADWDARQLCEVQPAESLDDLLTVARAVAEAGSGDPALIVCGSGVDQSSQHFDLSNTSSLMRFGPAESAIRSARDPRKLARLLKDSGLAALEVQTERGSIDDSQKKHWIMKPLSSGGGMGVRRRKASPPTNNSHFDHETPNDREFFYQEFVEGPVFGASFVGHSQGARLVGVCAQVVEPLQTANGLENYVYHGSIGPIELAESVLETLCEMAETIVREFQLFGWFGIDFVLKKGSRNEPETVWLLEINPRYTASMEILERSGIEFAGESTCASMFALHHRAISRSGYTLLPTRSLGKRLFGKRYVFNRSSKPLLLKNGSFQFLKSMSEQPDQSSAARFVTDIPDASNAESLRIPVGAPICTVWVRRDSGFSESKLRSELKRFECLVVSRLEQCQ